ncbi:DUF262 domain-containing protein [Shewanella sp. SM23]|uniref:DUF262 domain-containing protein n=1 Tax=Shewanella TaxID=22 RepID=UPI0021DB5D03|nr:DUF262 domain-containing protein [Shewanella sp. SM23]MCU8085358.1 DUF262 domain-containing protein [Shewanella sp. SM23]
MKKIDGEVFKREKIKVNAVDMSDDDINAKYKRGEIRIVTEQARYPVKSIKSMLEGGDYKLNPEYQRRKRWDNGRKSRLIESFIMNVPLPPIFLYEYDYSKFEVMDGLQRLTTIFDFYSGSFALEELGYWKELEGKLYDELPEEIQKGIDRRYISSIVLLEETAKTPEEAETLKQIVFERLNSGGEKLTPQETRNALYNGSFNQLCLKLSKNEKFRIMWGIPLESSGEDELLTSEAYRRMDDVELVLRFFAYRFIDVLTGTVEEFLDDYLKQANKFSTKTLKSLEKLFNDTIDTTYAIFGEEAFFSPVYERRVTKPQKTIYDPLMQSIAKHIQSKDKLLLVSDEIKANKYSNETEVDGERIFYGRNTIPSVVKMRIEYFDNLLSPYLK